MEYNKNTFIFFLLFIISCKNKENEMIAVDVNYTESNLPIISINTFGVNIPDEPRIEAHMGIINNNSGTNNISDVFNDYDGKITIEKRGNSSQDQEKPPYRFETVDNSGENNNVQYSYNNIEQDTNSISETFILSRGSKFIKNEINCNLKEKFSSAFVNGVFSLSGENHHEIRSQINHLSENTKSYQLIKSVMSDKSKSVYQGKIYVDKVAQKTDGYQLSKAILLNDETEFNAKPELEIYADDVKCSHGSASGNLDENSIFYLRSRGLNYKEARSLLINGFLLEVIEKITDTQIKNFIKNILGLK